MPLQVLVHAVIRLANVRLLVIFSDLAHVGPVDLQPGDGLIFVAALKPGVSLHDVWVVQLAPNRLSLVVELPCWVSPVKTEHRVMHLLIWIGPVLNCMVHVWVTFDIL